MDRFEQQAGYAGTTPAWAPTISAEHPGATNPDAVAPWAVAVDAQGNPLAPTQAPAGPTTPGGTAPQGEGQEPGQTPAALPPEVQAFLDKKSRDLEAGYTRKFQQVAEQRRELDRLTGETNARLAALERQSENPGTNPAGEPEPFETLPPDVRAQFDTPEGRKAINVMARITDYRLNQRMGNLDDKYAPKDVVNAVRQAEQVVRVQKLSQEIEALKPVYGAVFDAHGPDIVRALESNPGLNVQAAMNLVAPQAVTLAAVEAAKRELTVAYQQQQAASVLEGGGRPGASADYRPKPGESTESVARNMFPELFR